MALLVQIIRLKKGEYMGKASPKNLILGLLGLCTVVSIGGAVSSSLAWYAYAARANLMYSGTSVFDNGQLQIGLKSSVEIPELKTEEAGMSEELHNGSYYYFAPAGEGLTSDLMNIYLNARGYASNELIPITSGEFTRNDTSTYGVSGGIELKQAPSADVHAPDYQHNAAPIISYSQITFAFRAFKTDGIGSQINIEGQEIWLSYAQTRASDSSSGNVSKAMRMFVNRDASIYGSNNGFIFNPSSKNAGFTKVAGLLNIGFGQYYDFDENGEVVYGEYEFLDGIDSGIINSHYSGPDEIIDINGSGSLTPDTFTAKHSPEAPAYYENLDKLDLKKAQYEGVDTVKPHKDGNGILSNEDPAHPTSVCITGGESVGYIGEFDATIYLEGWDFSVIDEEQKHKFDFQLRFETNRV